MDDLDRYIIEQCRDQRFAQAWEESACRPPRHRGWRPLYSSLLALDLIAIGLLLLVTS